MFQLKNSAKFMELVYELLDELIGGILPGIYFCTYFLMCAYIIVGDRISMLTEANTYLIGIPFLAVAYVIGTLFKRGSLDVTDMKSVKYIMKSKKNKVNHTEYILDLPDNYIANNLLTKIIHFKENYRLFISVYYIKNSKRFWQIEKRSQYTIYFYIKRKIRRAYRLSTVVGVLLYPIIVLYKDKNKHINRLVKKNDELCMFYNRLESDCNFKVDYPYTHLKQYLENNGMSDLAKYVKWSSTDGRETKAFVNGIIALLTENQYLGMKQIKKREAHIRFMNAAFHSQTSLFFCAKTVFLIILFLLLGRFAWLWSVDFPNVTFTFTDDQKISFVIDKFFDYISRVVKYEDLFIILCISAVYMLFYRITRKLVLGNFHYQRIHEIVNLLQAKKYVLETKLLVNNNTENPPLTPDEDL